MLHHTPNPAISNGDQLEVNSVEPAEIPGTAPPELKSFMADWHQRCVEGLRDGFGGPVYGRLRLTEVSLSKVPEAPGKMEVRIVMEGKVCEDMLNPHGTLHGGCTAFLVDMCSSHPLILLSQAQGQFKLGVSQAINMLYHSPAQLGDCLRIVSTSVTLGGRIMSSRCEIWDGTHNRLVASGAHIKMAPSDPFKL